MSKLSNHHHREGRRVNIIQGGKGWATPDPLSPAICTPTREAPLSGGGALGPTRELNEQALLSTWPAAGGNVTRTHSFSYRRCGLLSQTIHSEPGHSDTSILTRRKRGALFTLEKKRSAFFATPGESHLPHISSRGSLHRQSPAGREACRAAGRTVGVEADPTPLRWSCDTQNLTTRKGASVSPLDSRLLEGTEFLVVTESQGPNGSYCGHLRHTVEG